MNDLHRPTGRDIPGGKTAVLFVHGLLGTPRFWQPFIDALPEDAAWRALLLPGHGGSVREFGHVPKGAWREEVDQAIRDLCARYERVYIVAHSLGTLLSISSLTEGRAPVKGMLLIAVPLHIRMSPRTVLHNICKGLGVGEDRAALATYYGVEPDARFWRYVSWLPRYAEFFRESAAACKALPRLTVPAQAFFSPADELVSARSIPPLKACPALRLTMLTTSGHHHFVPEDLAVMQTALRQMIADSSD